jgi:hypothetical protein
MVFKPKIPNLGKFWRAFEWEMLVYFMTIWNILWPFGIIYIWSFGIIYIWPFGKYNLWSFVLFFPNLECLDQENFGNPALRRVAVSMTLASGT